MAELADARDSKSRDRKIVRVQVSPSALTKKRPDLGCGRFLNYKLYSSKGSGKIIFRPVSGIASLTFTLVSLLNARLK